MPAKAIRVTVGGKDVPVAKSKRLSDFELVLMSSKVDHNFRELVSQRLKRHKLTKTSWLVLGVVASAGEDGVIASSIARRLGLSGSQVTGASQALMQRHALRQRTKRDDRRSYSLFLTARGKVLFEDSTQAVGEALEKWLGGIPDNHLLFYQKVLAALATRQLPVVADQKKPSVIK